MTSKIMFVGTLALAGGLVAACSSGSAYQTPPAPPPPSMTPPPPPPPTTMTQSLNTAQVLALARVSSETSSPFAVDGGALTLNDTSETSTPIVANTM